MTFGERLKHEREARGVAVDEIAAATKISSRYIEALERDEFEHLPGDVFIKGYVRAVAQVLGSDADALVREFVLQRRGPVAPTGDDADAAIVRELSRVLKVGEEPEPRGTIRVPRVPAKLLAAAAGAAILALAAWAGTAWLRPSRQPPLQAATRSGPSPAAPGVPVPPPPADRAAPEPPAGPARQAVSPPPQERSSPPGVAPSPPSSPPPSVSSPPDAGPQPRVVAPAKVEPERTGTRPKVQPKPPPPARPSTSPSASRGDRPRLAPAPERASVPPPPAPPIAAPPPAPSAPMIVAEHGVGTGVIDRRLVGRADRFPAGSEIFFWTRVLRGEADGAIRHVWIHEGREVLAVDLPVGSPDWRTQSRFVLPAGAVGGWAVEARDPAGRVLARQAFVCSS